MTIFGRIIDLLRALFGRGGRGRQDPIVRDSFVETESREALVEEPHDEPDIVDDPAYDIDNVTDDDNTPRDPLPDPDLDTVEFVAAAMVPVEPWKERQQWLKDLGYDPGPVDGKPGKRTDTAVRAFQKDQGLTVDGMWGPKTDAAARAALREKGQPALIPPPPSVFLVPLFEDMIGDVVLDEDFWLSFEDLTSKSNVLDEKGRRRRKGTRKIAALVRLCWHQTAFTWKPYRVLKAAKKFSNHNKINAHVCFDTDGTILLVHPLLAYLWTANTFNPDCLSFEIMGNFEGILGTANWYLPDKFGRARPTRLQILRARQLTKWLLAPEQGPPDDKLPAPLREWRLGVRELGRNPLKWVNAHRQATDDRGLDCGSECWYHVVRWTVERHPTMSVGPEKGRGMKIPSEWMAKPAVPPLA
jgi:hypothetical protein